MKKENIFENNLGVIFTSRGYSCYETVATHGELLCKIMNSKAPRFFEYISGDSIVNPFFDIELDRKGYDSSLTDIAFLEMGNELVNFVYDTFTSSLGDDFNYLPLVLKAHKYNTVNTLEKYSVHLIIRVFHVNGVALGFRGVKTIQRIVELWLDSRVGIDKSVYREGGGLFRTILSSKPKEIRQLVLTKSVLLALPTYICDDSFVFELHTFVTYFPELMEVLEVVPGITLNERCTETRVVRTTKKRGVFVEAMIEGLVQRICLSYNPVRTYPHSYDALRNIYFKEVVAVCPNLNVRHKSNNCFVSVSATAIYFNCHDKECGDGLKFSTSENLNEQTILMLFTSESLIKRELVKFIKDKKIDTGVTELFECDEGYYAPTTEGLNPKYIRPGVGTHRMFPNEQIVQHVDSIGATHAVRVPEYTQTTLFKYIANRTPVVFTQNITNNVVVNKPAETVSAEKVKHESTLQLGEEIKASIRGKLGSTGLEEAFVEWWNFPSATNCKLILLSTNILENIVFSNGEFYTYNGKHWQPKVKSEMKGYLNEVMDGVIRRVRKLLEKGGLNENLLLTFNQAVIKLLTGFNTTTMMAFLPNNIADNEFGDKLDNNWNLIGFQNGVYELEKDIFREHRRADHMTKLVDYDYSSTAKSEWLNSLLVSIMPLQEHLDFLLYQTALALGGKAPNDKLNFLVGNGSNGKTVYTRLINKTFGPYCGAVGSTLLTRNEGNAADARPELYNLKNVRCAFVAEPEEGKLKTPIVKKMCGADVLVCRQLYNNKQNQFVMRTRFFVIANHPPEFSSNDEAVWRRVQMIAFSQKFVEVPTRGNEHYIDESLGDSIENDVNVRQAFIVILLNSREPKPLPEAFRDAVQSQKNRECSLGVFLEEYLYIDPNGFVTNSDIIACYYDYLGGESQSVSVKHKTLSAQVNVFIHTHFNEGNKEVIKYGSHRQAGSNTGKFIRGWKGLSVMPFESSLSQVLPE